MGIGWEVGWGVMGSWVEFEDGDASGGEILAEFCS